MTIMARRRGLGQVMPSCASVDPLQTVPQAVLLGGGSLAMLVGIVGAVASDQYRKQFAYAAGAGLLANIVGGIWAANTVSNIYASCGGAQGLADAMAQVNQLPGVPAEQAQIQPTSTPVAVAQ
jgi:hypothetical protein